MPLTRVPVPRRADLKLHELQRALALAGEDIHGVEERGGQVTVILKSGDPQRTLQLVRTVDKPPRLESEIVDELRQVLREIREIDLEPEEFATELEALEDRRRDLKSKLRIARR